MSSKNSLARLLWPATLALLLLALFVFTVAPVPAVAQENGDDEEEIDYSALKTRRTPVLSEKVYKKLAQAQERVETEKDFSGARNILESMIESSERGRSRLNAYELANVWNTIGFLDYSQERYRSAVRSYRQVIADPEAIPQPLLTSALYTLAQLSFVLERYRSAIRYLGQWLQIVEDPPPDPWFLRSQAYFQREDTRRALNDALRGKAVAERKGVAMRENWYLLFRALYYENKDYRQVAQVLRELLKGWPKKTYWIQMSGIHGQLEESLNRMTAMELADLQGLLTKEKEILGLTYQYLAQDLPYKAASLLAEGLERKQVERSSKHLELLGSAWQNARELEKALPVLEEAAKLSDKGEIYARLSSVYLDLYRYEEAARAARAGLKKGNLRRADTLNVILGMALFNVESYDDASKAFTRAGEDERSERLSQQWREYIEKQLERKRLLEQDISDPEILKLLKG